MEQLVSQPAAAEATLKTIPVPVLVGPPGNADHLAAAAANATPADGSGIALDAVTSGGVVAPMMTAELPAIKPPTAGGWFFSKPMAAVEWLLTSVHDVSGLPWWATIALTTVSVRACLLPVQIYQSKSIARMALIRPQIDEHSAAMREASQKGTPKGMEDAEKARMALSKLFEKHNVKPWMSIVGAIVQLPLWITFFFTMRHMSRVDAGIGMDTGGMLWFQDLTQSDPYYLLPLGMGASFFTMASLGDAGQPPGAKLDPKQAQMKVAMKMMAFIMVPATSGFQSGIFVYWITTNLSSITQTLILRQPVVRSLAGMPALPNVSAAAAKQAALTPVPAPFVPLANAVPGVLLSALNLEQPGTESGGSGGAASNPMAPAPREVIDPAKLATSVSAQGSRPPPPPPQPASGTKPKGKGKKRRR